MPGCMVPGHQAIPGSLKPPSNVVCLPHNSGPLLPPGMCFCWELFFYRINVACLLSIYYLNFLSTDN